MIDIGISRDKDTIELFDAKSLRLGERNGKERRLGSHKSGIIRVRSAGAG